MFIWAESAISSAGQPSSVASSLRAAKLLSMSRSFSRSTMEVRQFSCCGFAAARCSSCATTSTRATALGGGGAAGIGLGLAGAAVGGEAGVAAAAVLPMPRVSKMVLKNPMVLSFDGWTGWRDPGRRAGTGHVSRSASDRSQGPWLTARWWLSDAHPWSHGRVCPEHRRWARCSGRCCPRPMLSDLIAPCRHPFPMTRRKALYQMTRHMRWKSA